MNTSVIRLLKENKLFLFIVSWLYNITFSPSTIFNVFRGGKTKINGTFLR